MIMNEEKYQNFTRICPTKRFNCISTSNYDELHALSE